MDHPSSVAYNKGNLEKYQSGNPLKKYLVKRFDDKLMNILLNINGGGTAREINVLDAGCGEGILSAMMRDRFPKMKIRGVDGAAEAVRIARGLCPSVEFSVANIYELPFPNQSFDMVVCSEVLEHLDRPRDAMRELDRVAHHMLVSVPHEPWFCMGNLLALHNVSRLGNPADHVNHWTANGFKDFMKSFFGDRFVDCKFDASFPWSIMWR